MKGIQINRKARAVQPQARGKAKAGILCGEVLTRRELAAQLKTSVRTVDRMVAAGEIPVVRLRGATRFHWPEVLAALQAN